MKRLFIFCVFSILLFSSNGFCGMLIGSGIDTGSASCTTDSETTAYGGTIAVALTATSDAWGQSFQVATNSPLSAIGIYGGATTAGATLEIRWGPTSDLSSTYESTSVTWGAADDNTWGKGTFTTKGAITGATTYYLGVALTSGDISIGSDNTNPYADGTTMEQGTGFVLGGTNVTYDLAFRIYQCD